MKRLSLSLFSLALVLTTLVPLQSIAGQQRRVVRHARVAVRRPVVRTRLIVRNGYPIRRVLPATVLVRPAAGRVVPVDAPLTFLPSVVWSPTVVAMPASDRLVWQDSESMRREEGWVDSNFGVDSEGGALFLQINGVAELNFAEVTFANGNVQVVDFNGSTHGTGIYALLDFADGRHVKTVRLLAKSQTNETNLAVYLSK